MSWLMLANPWMANTVVGTILHTDADKMVRGGRYKPDVVQQALFNSVNPITNRHRPLTVQVSAPMDAKTKAPKPLVNTPAAQIPMLVGNLPGNPMQVDVHSDVGKLMISQQAIVDARNNTSGVWYHITHPSQILPALWSVVETPFRYVGWTWTDFSNHFQNWDGSLRGLLRDVEIIWRFFLLCVVALGLWEIRPLLDALYEVATGLGQVITMIFRATEDVVVAVMDMLQQMFHDISSLVI